ncbi:hypothetical protein Agub_g5659, partial [Astrephomene gubernaculifera]
MQLTALLSGPVAIAAKYLSLHKARLPPCALLNYSTLAPSRTHVVIYALARRWLLSVTAPTTMLPRAMQQTVPSSTSHTPSTHQPPSSWPPLCPNHRRCTLYCGGFRAHGTGMASLYGRTMLSTSSTATSALLLPFTTSIIASNSLQRRNTVRSLSSDSTNKRSGHGHGAALHEATSGGSGTLTRAASDGDGNNSVVAISSSSTRSSSGSSSGGGGAAGGGLQGVDYSTLAASCWELREGWVPAKVEQVVMPDKTSLCLRLRTPSSSGWLRVCWHPVAGRLAMMTHGSVPERGNASELYSLGEQVHSALAGRVLVGVSLPAAWERVAALRFGERPGEPPSHHLYCEVMARYSNVILTDASDTVLAAAYQVGGMMSSHRQVQVGRTYCLPPQLFGVPPDHFAAAISAPASDVTAASPASANTTASAAPSGHGGDHGVVMEAWRQTLVRAAALAAQQQQQQQQQRQAGEEKRRRAAKSGGSSSSSKSGNGDGSGGASDALAAAATDAAVTAAPVSAAPAVVAGEGRLVDGFIRAFHGVSPALVEELCRTACASLAATAATTSSSSSSSSSSDSSHGSSSSSNTASSHSPQSSSPSSSSSSPPSISPDCCPASLGEEAWAALYGAWLGWQARLRSGGFEATSDPDTGRYSVFGSLPRRHASVHALLEDYYGPLAAAEAHAQLYGKLAAAVAAALKKARGKVGAFQRQLSESGRCEEVRRQADLITANLYRIPPGSPTAEVEDWETGQPLTLQLDPTKPPVATAEALYRKARKLKRAVDAVQPLLEEAQGEVSYLEEIEVGLAGLKRWSGDAADMTALREIQDELVSGKYMKPPPDAALAHKTAARASKAAARAAGKSAKGGKGGAGGAAGVLDSASASSARRFTSPGGFTVLVGRNNKQNDVISSQIAADDDLWFHVRGLPGSHTLLRVTSGSSASSSSSSSSSRPQAGPSEDDIQFAADLAAFYSRAKDSLKVDVVMTRGSWVRKPRGAKPGAVAVTKELRNVVGRPGRSVAAAEGA